MATPQVEDGYVRIARELMDALCKHRIPGEARQVLDFIIRKTYGFNKKADEISLSQFESGTGLKRPAVCRALRKLQTSNMIIKDAKPLPSASLYSVNKDYDNWDTVSKKTPCQKVHSDSGFFDNQTVAFSPHTIDTLTKDNTKDIYPENEKQGFLTPETPAEPSLPERIILHFNETFKTRYRANTEDIKKLIKARLKDKFTLEDFYEVHRRMKIAWGDDPKQRQYLRPHTLYTGKFQSYLHWHLPEVKGDSEGLQRQLEGIKRDIRQAEQELEMTDGCPKGHPKHEEYTRRHEAAKRRKRELQEQQDKILRTIGG